MEPKERCAMLEQTALRRVPRFLLNGDDMRVIGTPSEFFATVKNLIMAAKRRVCIVSLYLGTDEGEQLLVDALDTVLRDRTNVHALLLFDYCRAMRGQRNSCTMVSGLKTAHGQRFQLALFHTPLLRSVWKRIIPHRWNEVFGVQHMKFYLIDDDVIISGANLSKDYFTNRQDRYVLIRSTDLADFFVDLAETVSRHSFQLQPDGQLALHDECKTHPFAGQYSRFCQSLRTSVLAMMSKWYELQAGRCLENVDTVIYPLIQFGAADLHSDRQIVELFFEDKFSEKQYELCMSSGYFNPSSTYIDALLKSSKLCRVLYASVEANGFHHAKGFSRHVPFIYLHYANRFRDSVLKSGQHDRILLYEYLRSGWTFHAKGLWLQPLIKQLPYISVVGSSNFGCRSAFRDLECQLVICTCNEKKKEEFANECASLFVHSKRIEKPGPNVRHLDVTLFDKDEARRRVTEPLHHTTNYFVTYFNPRMAEHLEMDVKKCKE